MGCCCSWSCGVSPALWMAFAASFGLSPVTSGTDTRTYRVMRRLVMAGRAWRALAITSIRFVPGASATAAEKPPSASGVTGRPRTSTRAVRGETAPEILVLLASIRASSAGELRLSFTGAAAGGRAVLPQAPKNTVDCDRSEGGGYWCSTPHPADGSAVRRAECLCG